MFSFRMAFSHLVTTGRILTSAYVRVQSINQINRANAPIAVPTLNELLSICDLACQAGGGIRSRMFCLYSSKTKSVTYLSVRGWRVSV